MSNARAPPFFNLRHTFCRKFILKPPDVGGFFKAGYIPENRRLYAVFRFCHHHFADHCDCPRALMQNVKDLLASREIENILDNTDFMVLLSQAQSDRAILAKQLGISEHQLSYITHSNSGEGLLFYGNVTIPFVDRFPRGEIYDLLTSRPEDLAHERTDE